MGWLWGSTNDPKSAGQLDPTLREFLKKEAPNGPKPALPPTAKDNPDQKSNQESTPAASPDRPEPQAPTVPPQSQFQDGRYAHLWKNYTPQDVLNERGKNEQDRLRDLVDAYNDRKSSIGRIAMENCALEYMEQFDCFRNPTTWWSAGTMCNAESRKFNRCYEMQSKFLRALGYMTMDARTPEEDERIQMHADKLYQQMLQQEAAAEKAKEEGRPAPDFESVLSKRSIARAEMKAIREQGGVDPSEENDIWSQIKPESRKEYEKKLATLPPQEQEIERMAILGELKASRGMVKQVEQTFIEERISRLKRRESGQSTIGDTIKYWWGWG